MIARSAVIYDSSEIKNELVVKSAGDLNGNSNVGQASEFPLRSFARAFLIFSFCLLLNVIRISHPTITAKAEQVTLKPSAGPSVQISSASQVLIKQIQPQAHFSGVKTVDLSAAPDPNFSIVIPSINATGKVVADVDPFIKDDYMPALKIGVAQAHGTGLPGVAGANIFMFAHSTNAIENVAKYNAIFYLLKDVKVGDKIDVYYKYQKFSYQVYDKKIVSPDDTSFLTPKSPDGQERLVLQSCWPPGTVLKRVIVSAHRSDT
jgi:LPXTG-site transpeptidase (sortase) family protein